MSDPVAGDPSQLALASPTAISRLSSWRSGAIRAGTLGLATGWVMAAAAPRDFPVGTFVDDAQYVVLAKSLREHYTYRTLNLPGGPAETKYPPLFPALLATVWSPGAGVAANLERARLVNLALLGPLAAVLAAAGVGLFRLPPLASVVAVTAGLASAPAVNLWTMPMAEPLSLLLVTLSLWFADAGRWRSAALAGAMGALARTLALPFLAVVLVEAWRRGGRREGALAAAIGGVLLAPWLAWSLAHGAETPNALLGIHGSYGAWYADAVRADPATVLFLVPLKNVLLLARAAGTALLGWSWLHAAVLAALGSVVIGLVAGWTGARVVPLGLGLYAVAILLWPFPQADRFVGGVWALVLLAALAALPAARARLPVAAGVLALALVGFARGEGVRGHRAAGTAAARLFPAIRPVVAGSRAVAVSNPPLYYLSLGVPTVPNERMRAWRWYRQGYWATAWGLGDDLWPILDRYHPDFVIVEQRGPEGRWAVGSLMRQCPGILREVWHSQTDEAVFQATYGAVCAPVKVER
ncbi:MAG: hypothetical protein ACHQC8_06645 [Solirubrobacterales bacterium]